MENTKNITTILEEIDVKKEFIYTLSEVVREFTERAVESKIPDNDTTQGNMYATGYELHRVHPHIENIHHIIHDLNKEVDDLLEQAIDLAKAQ